MLWLEGIGPSCPRFSSLPPTPVISAVVSISYHFNYCPANPGSSASPGVWHEIPRPLTVTSSSKLIFFTPIPLTEEGGYFRFGILANHLASIFFSLVTECKYLLAFTLTHILYLHSDLHYYSLLFSGQPLTAC